MNLNFEIVVIDELGCLIKKVSNNIDVIIKNNINFRFNFRYYLFDDNLFLVLINIKKFILNIIKCFNLILSGFFGLKVIIDKNNLFNVCLSIPSVSSGLLNELNVRYFSLRDNIYHFLKIKFILIPIFNHINPGIIFCLKKRKN